MIDISTINTLCPHRIDNISDPPWWLSDQTIGRIQMQVRFFVGCASIIQLFFRSRRGRYWEDWSGEAEGHWRGGEKGAEWVRLSHWDLWYLEPFPLITSLVKLWKLYVSNKIMKRKKEIHPVIWFDEIHPELLKAVMQAQPFETGGVCRSQTKPR